MNKSLSRVRQPNKPSTIEMVYSDVFLLKMKPLEECQVCPEEIVKLQIEIVNQPQDYGGLGKKCIKKSSSTQWTKGKTNVPIIQLRTETLVRCSNPWKPNIEEEKKPPADIKRMTGILNKLNDNNYTKLVEESKTFNYSDSAIVSLIFKKVLAEPFFAELYANFCKSLVE